MRTREEIERECIQGLGVVPMDIELLLEIRELLENPPLEISGEPEHNDLSKCPECGGVADNGFSRTIPPEPYYCTKCEYK